jgi:hypothetical protein
MGHPRLRRLREIADLLDAPAPHLANARNAALWRSSLEMLRLKEGCVISEQTLVQVQEAVDRAFASSKEYDLNLLRELYPDTENRLRAFSQQRLGSLFEDTPTTADRSAFYEHELPYRVSPPSFLSLPRALASFSVKLPPLFFFLET